jgi:L-malate glycosyltransferase
MKILQFVTRRQRRGAEVFAAQLADGLARRGHEVIFASLYSTKTDNLVTDTAEVRDLNGRRRFPLSVRLISELRALIGREKPDLVQANGSATLKYLALTKRISGGSWPLVYRNIGIASDWLRHPGHRALGRWLLRSVDHVAAVSHASLADFRETYRVSDWNISTIPIGVAIPVSNDPRRDRSALAASIGTAGGEELIVHVGSLTAEKNHLWLLWAFSEIAARRPGVHLVLMGDGPLRDRVEAEIARRGLGGRVHLLGSRADAATLVGGADLFVLPSATEGIPGALLEASARGVPVVATDVGSVHEAVDDGRTGVLIRAGALDAFVGSVISLLERPQERREMGAAGRMLVRERFDLDGIVDRFEALYVAIRSGQSMLPTSQPPPETELAGSWRGPHPPARAGVERP